MWKVSCIVRAGWSGRKLSASKLKCSVSTSGPSAISHPIATNTSATWSEMMRDRVPGTERAASRDGRVTSMASATRTAASRSASSTSGARRRQPARRCGDVDPLARVCALLARQRAERTLGERDGRLVAEVVDLRPRERIEVGSGRERLALQPSRPQRAPPRSRRSDRLPAGCRLHSWPRPVQLLLRRTMVRNVLAGAAATGWSTAHRQILCDGSGGPSLHRGPVLHPRAGVQADRRGGREVQALGTPRIGIRTR